VNNLLQLPVSRCVPGLTSKVFSLNKSESSYSSICLSLYDILRAPGVFMCRFAVKRSFTRSPVDKRMLYLLR